MQIWFCQACGARVTKAELGHVPGLTASTLVYCKDCLKTENRSERAQQTVKAERPGSATTRPPSKSVRRKSTRNVSRVVQPEPEESVALDDAEEPGGRRNRRTRFSGAGLPRAGSKTIQISAIAGGLLLVIGVILVNVNLSPEAAREAMPARQPAVSAPQPDATVPLKAAVDEKAASDAYGKLEKDVNALAANANPQKLALIDSYLKKWDESIAAARARNLRQKVEAASVEPENTAPNKAATAGAGSGDTDTPGPRMFISYTPRASPITLLETVAEKYIKAGDYKKAAAEYDRALELDPKNVDLLIGRASTCLTLADYEGCVLYTDRLLEVNPNAWTALALQAISAYILNKDTLYKVDLEKSLKLCPLDAEYKHTLKAWVEDMALRGRIWALGQQLERREPKNAYEFWIRGSYRWLTNRGSEGEVDLRRGIELDPPNMGEQCFRTLTQMADFSHDLKAKMEISKEWVRRLPQSALGLNNLAWELLTSEDETLRDAQAALPIAQHANELQPKNSAMLDTLAMAYFNNNDVKNAIDAERKAIELIPEDMPRSDRDVYTQHLTQFEFVKPPDP